MDLRIGIVLALAMAAVWISRRILQGLMFAGHAVSCFMMRQMEYDADSYEVKIAGSEAFAATMFRLRELEAGRAFGYATLGKVVTNGAAPLDLPAYLLDHTRRLPPDVLEQLQQVTDHEARWFETHPSDASRLHAARAQNDQGVLVGADGPATDIFSAFGALSVSATRHHYEHDLGLAVDALQLVATGQVLHTIEVRKDRRRACFDFFAGCETSLRPLQVPIRLPGVEPLDGAGSVNERDEAGHGTETLARKYRAYERMENRWVMALLAEELLTTGSETVDTERFDLASGTLDDARSTQAWAREEQQEVTPDLEAFEAAVSQRLSRGVDLASRRGSGDGGDGRVMRETVVTLVRAFNAVSSVMTDALDGHRMLMAVSLLESQTGQPVDPARGRRVAQLKRQADERRARIRRDLESVMCPAVLAPDSPMTLAEWCGWTTGLDADGQLPRVWSLYSDLLGELVMLIRMAEGGGSPPASTTSYVVSDDV